jgi:peptidoglycan hydrolase CwlO-like protein
MYKRITTQFATLLLCVCLVLSLGVPLLPASLAHADDLSDAQATLSAAEAQLASIAEEYNAIQARVAEVEGQIEETTNKAEEAQQAMYDGQKELGKVLVSSYKNEAANSLVNVFLASDSLESFIRNVTYYSSIEQQKSEQIEEQKKRTEQFNTVLDELDQQKSEQEALAAEAESKKAQAEQVVSSAVAKVSSIESERARVEALQQQANSLQGQQRPEASISDNWNTGNTSDGDSSGGSSNEDTSSAPSGSGWQTGIASAYGGESDKNTPNPGTTATGAICNDTSMGVAVPMSWPNYRSYLGRKVEIRYNGKTVIATVNDCGYMGGGSRSLDLQPGVFKKFGFSTCQAWGLRTVSYRFL